MYATYRPNPILDENAALGLLQYMSRDDLQRYMDNDNAVTEYIADLEQTKALQREKDNMLTNNRSIADYNLSCEPRLKTAVKQLADTYQNALQIHKKAEHNKIRLESVAFTQRAEDMLPILQTEAVKAEEDAESTAEKFLKKELDADRFIDDFIGKKILAHSRKVKVDKLQEMLQNIPNGVATQFNQQQWSTTVNAFSPQPYPSFQQPVARPYWQ